MGDRLHDKTSSGLTVVPGLQTPLASHFSSPLQNLPSEHEAPAACIL